MVIARILMMGVASTSEVEVCVLYHNAQEIISLQIAATEMRHPQPVTPIQIDNSTASGITNGTIK